MTSTATYSDPMMGKLDQFAKGIPIKERDFDVLNNLGFVMVERFVSLAGDSVRRSVTPPGYDALALWRRKNHGR